MSLESQIRDALAARASLAPTPSPAGPGQPGRRNGPALLAAVLALAAAVLVAGLVFAWPSSEELQVDGSEFVATPAVASPPGGSTATPVTTVAGTEAVSPVTSMTNGSERTTAITTSAPPPTVAPTTETTGPAIEPKPVAVTEPATSVAAAPEFPTTLPPPPEPQCGAPSGPAPLADGLVLSGDSALDGIRSAIVGRWVGTATVPEGWQPIGTVRLEFRADGSYRGWCTDLVSPVFYYSDNCDCSLNRYDVYDVSSDGSATADIDLAWDNDTYTTRGVLRRIEVEGNRLSFEFFPAWHGMIGPITYALTREPSG